MPDTPSILYWDSCVFLSYVKEYLSANTVEIEARERGWGNRSTRVSGLGIVAVEVRWDDGLFPLCLDYKKFAERGGEKFRWRGFNHLYLSMGISPLSPRPYYILVLGSPLNLNLKCLFCADRDIARDVQIITHSETELTGAS